LYYIEKLLAWLAFTILSRYHIEGKSNIPTTGPVLVVANHLSVADPPALGFMLGRKACFMAKEELFRHKLVGFFVRQFGAFPVYRGRSNRDAFRKAIDLLKQGNALVMFPEGKRSQDGVMQDGLPGAALIAYYSQVPILPVGIIGTEVIRGLKWIWRRPSININIGKVFYLNEYGSNPTREQLNAYTEVITNQIAVLIPKKYREPHLENNHENEN
jgi:1-acyl-sn-glycerol-3-phosphate acyltransferase